MRCLRSIAACMAMMMLAACGGWMDRTATRFPVPGGIQSAEAAAVLAALNRKNTDLKSFKGIGKLKFADSRGTESVRMAWAASDSDKIRMEALSVTGQPIFSMSSDGKWLYILSHSQHRFVKKKTTRSNLKQLITIPVRASDIVSLIAGRVPLCDHQSTSLIRDNDSSGYILELATRKGKVLQKIYLDENRQQVQRIELFELSGEMIYRAEFFNIRMIDGYNIPGRMIISGREDKSLELIIEKYWTNMDISPSTFVLIPPESWG